jgi:hypothetical protein
MLWLLKHAAAVVAAASLLAAIEAHFSVLQLLKSAAVGQRVAAAVAAVSAISAMACFSEVTKVITSPLKKGCDQIFSMNSTCFRCFRC